MDFVEQKTAIRKLTVSELRELPRDEIENFVATGLLEADLAAEVITENVQKKQDERQQADYSHAQAQIKKDDREKDADWLQHMSESYQRAYHQLMDTYDHAESQYGEIKTRAEKLKDRLREKAETAYRFGVPLPDGRVAFYDRKNHDFVDGATLQPLQGDDAKTAAQEFQKLSPKQQKANACYVDACNAYADASGISQAAADGGQNVEDAKTALKNSDGTISENELKQTDKDVHKQVDGLSSRLNKAQDTDANLDAALSADADDAGAPQTAVSQAKPISFASQIDTNAKPLGDGNGKTTTAFNALARPDAAPDMAVANTPVSPANRQPSIPAP